MIGLKVPRAEFKLLFPSWIMVIVMIPKTDYLVPMFLLFFRWALYLTFHWSGIEEKNIKTSCEKNIRVMKKKQIIRESYPNFIFYSLHYHFAYKIKISIKTKLSKYTGRKEKRNSLKLGKTSWTLVSYQLVFQVWVLLLINCMILDELFNLFVPEFFCL